MGFEVRQPTVLLVDDHPSVRLILTAGLKAQGFNVLTAATGEEALNLCRDAHGKVDVFLTDLGLISPDLSPEEAEAVAIPNGLVLIERAQELYPDIKFLLFTGHSDESLERFGLRADLVQFLRKPVELATLVATLRGLLPESTAGWKWKHEGP
ncbi:response regulator [Candidatus Nitrospira bockiana]